MIQEKQRNAHGKTGKTLFTSYTAWQQHMPQMAGEEENAQEWQEEEYLTLHCGREGVEKVPVGSEHVGFKFKLS